MTTKTLVSVCAIFGLQACSQVEGLTNQIGLVGDVFNRSSNNEIIDSRPLMTREIIENLDVSLLFVEKEDGRNGSLIPYPGTKDLQIWMGADGSTLTFKGPFLSATRGLGADLMGSSTPIETTISSLINAGVYSRSYQEIGLDDQIIRTSYECNMVRSHLDKTVEVFGETHSTKTYEETCKNQNKVIHNTYSFADDSFPLKSVQFVSSGIGYLSIELLK